MTKKKRGMRTGFTTGACAAAAARAAATGLAKGAIPEQIESLLPNGERVSFAVTEARWSANLAQAVVVKDAGDDPDVTDKARLTATIRLLSEARGEVRIIGGAGVGVVTREGLGLPVGVAAINGIPRKNIEENIREVAAFLLAQVGCEVTISVPRGAQMAKKTLNPRFGIIGGISILGTTGIVRPYSTAAFRDTVAQGVEMAAAQGYDTVALTTGGRTEKFAMRILPELDLTCFVQMGDFVKTAMKSVIKRKIGNVIIVGMAGKLMKMAQGERVTHAGRNRVDMNLVAELAREAGGGEAMVADIRSAETARYAVERLASLGKSAPFFAALARRVVKRMERDYPGNYTLTIYACDFDGKKNLAEAKGGGRHD